MLKYLQNFLRKLQRKINWTWRGNVIERRRIKDISEEVEWLWDQCRAVTTFREFCNQGKYLMTASSSTITIM